MPVVVKHTIVNGGRVARRTLTRRSSRPVNKPEAVTKVAKQTWAKRPVQLTDIHINRLLRRPETGNEFPSLRSLSFLLRKQKKPKANCSRCSRMSSRAHLAIGRKARHLLSTMSKSDIAHVKSILGVTGPLRITYERNRIGVKSAKRSQPHTVVR